MTQRHETSWSRPRGLTGLAAAVGVGLLLGACSDPATTTADGAPSATTVIVPPPPSDSTSPDSTSPDSAPSDGTTSDGTSPDNPAGAEPPADATPWPELPLSLQPIVNLVQPTALTVRPGSDDLWLLERPGRVRRIDRTVDGSTATERLRLLTEPVLDITGQVTTEGEGGLLGMAFSPDGGMLYLHYTDRRGDNVIAEYPMDGDQARAGAERILLQVDEPFSNHNGGDLSIGPDGLLYIGLGDGGSSGDPQDNGQDRTTLLGSILRIDPRPAGDLPYTVPNDNPFVDATDGSRPEIWIWGARNPWRFSFDRSNGDLWIADVGQNRFEEINLLPASDGSGRGANLGWNLVEGNEPFAGDPPSDHVPPIYTYAHESGRCSVTGGYVYRGPNLTSLDGVYLYSDYCTGELNGLERRTDGSVVVANLLVDGQVENVIGFGEGPSGELYVLEQNGAVSRLQSSDWPLETVVVADT